AVARVPATVTVAAGGTSANFTITTSTVAAVTQATISATFAGIGRTATLTVLPTGVAPVASTTPPVQTCASYNFDGFPYSGTLCGRGFRDNCTPGVLYTCTTTGSNNCTLARVCPVGCLTGPNDTSPDAVSATPVANDACFTGPPPLVFSSNPVV